MKRSLLLAVLVVACDGPSEPPPAAVPAPSGAPSAVPANEQPSAPPPTDADAPEKICVAVMRRTRTCAEHYVPGLLDLRVRLDQPPGIAKRYEDEGRHAMVMLAHEQFAADWSDQKISDNCAELAAKPPEEQARIIEPERACLKESDCEAFTRCDLANKEARWTTSN